MSTAATPLFSCEGLGVSVAGRTLVKELTMRVANGELLAILGQNGSGKTLTMHTLAGLRSPEAGRIYFNTGDITTVSRQELAKHLALLPQHVDDIFPATVLDTALIGRHPHIGRFNWESEQDIQIATAALQAVDLDALTSRDVLTLSGGERRRLAIAQVLTQAPQLFLLDEPTNHLDPQHQLDALRLFRAKADAGAAVIASLHDVNLAVRFSDRCLLLYGNGQWDLGPTASILTAQRLGKLYGTTMDTVRWRDKQLFIASGDEAA